MNVVVPFKCNPWNWNVLFGFEAMVEFTVWVVLPVSQGPLSVGHPLVGSSSAKDCDGQDTGWLGAISLETTKVLIYIYIYIKKENTKKFNIALIYKCFDVYENHIFLIL